jgi:hypothetical protein
MQNCGYEQTIKLDHNEIPAKFNLETGEIAYVGIHRSKNKTKGIQEKHEPGAKFYKNYPASWAFLKKNLEPYEYMAAHSLALRAKANTNSLEPLNDDTVISILVEEIGVSKNRVKSVLQHLFDLGVYGRFDIAEVGKRYTKYWILNPYLSFNGTIIDKSISELFKNTLVAKAFRGEI